MQFQYRRYSFKKRRTENEEEFDAELEESVRTLTSILSRASGGSSNGVDTSGGEGSGGGMSGGAGTSGGEPLESRVAAISAEIAAALAQAQARMYDEGEEDEEETGPEEGYAAQSVGPLVSGIRDTPGTHENNRAEGVGGGESGEEVDELGDENDDEGEREEASPPSPSSSSRLLQSTTTTTPTITTLTSAKRKR